MRRLAMTCALAAVLALGTPALTSASVSDAWITAKTKMALLTTSGVHATEVNVDTVDGRVTLHGTVGSAAEKTKAAQVARKIDGVKEVHDLLQVTPEQAKSAARASDDAVKERVTEALERDKDLQGSSISVQSVHDGVVLLKGDAKTMSAHLRAVEDAARVPGVQRVASEIKSPNTFADAEIRRDETGEAAKADAGRGIGGAASDMWITSATKLRLLADGDTPAMSINVDTRDGVVTLFGTVASEEAKRAAEADAHKVDGVKQVVNDIQIVPKSQQKVVKAKDADIQKSVKRAIDKHPNLENAKVTVQVENGVVRLSGTVPSEQDRLQAAVAARSAPGVRSVLPDELRVRSATK